MGNRNLKFVKPIASIILGAAVMTTAIVGTPNNVEAASNYKVSNGKLISKTTGKSVKGTKIYKGKVYKNGKLLNGLKSGVYYNKGKKASGTYKGKYYSKGKVYSGVKSGIYYKSGTKATGTYKNKYYSKGKVYTGLKSGIYYKNGAKGTGTHKGKYYETGKVLSGLQSKSGDLYIDGVLNTGLTLFEGKLYNGAKVNEGVINFDGKWYSGSAIATGTIKTPDGQTIVVENGVPTTPPGNNNGGSTNNGGGSSNNGGGSTTESIALISNETALKAALKNEKVKTIKLTQNITTTTQVAPKAGVTIDGGNNILTIDTESVGNNTADGLYIAETGIVIKNLTVTRSAGSLNKDNLIEIYNSTTLENVKAKNGAKAGIYVNNEKTGEITVNFKGVHTEGNGWNAGIGLVAQLEGSSINANFSGENTFGEDVAVYTDDSDKYRGIYLVSGLVGYEKNEVGNQDKWILEKTALVSNEEELTSALKEEKVKTIKLTQNITTTSQVAPKAGVTIDGGNKILTIDTASAGNNNTADGLYIAEAGIFIKNLTVTRSEGSKNTDNLIEIYNSTTLENVTAINGAKAGIYVNNDKTGEITVNFKGVHTTGNGWNAGIGLVAQLEGSIINANFSGENTFGEDVAVYTDDSSVYEGKYEISEIYGYKKGQINQKNQYEWKKESID
ncbi:pectate lyase-like adhesive domain-containing protein [Viridibacillus arvi]|uniref:pectate lyase-like adhesive domain-containing protein n=1 Tax=Viridibacillus arvi TaxID=263475 RepID=UPI0036EA686B